MPTQAQLNAQKKFKANVKKAKAIKKRHPNMKYQTAVKIAYGKITEPKCKTTKCKGKKQATTKRKTKKRATRKKKK